MPLAHRSTKALAAALAVVLLGPVGAAEGKRRSLCEHRGKAVEGSGFDDRRRVYTTTTQTRYGAEQRLSACRRGSRARSKHLAGTDRTAQGGSSFDALIAAASGRLVWVGTGVEEPSVAFGDLSLLDTVTGKVRASFPDEGSDSQIPRFEVTEAGGLAILGDGDRVELFDADGGRSASAPGATDLAGAGNTVYWTVGGVQTGAVLRGAPTGELKVP